MRVLVTGADGFVSQHLLPLLEADGHQTTATVLLPADVARVTHAKTVLPVDITDATAIREVIHTADPEWIIHLAGFTSVAASFAQPDVAWKVNVEGSRNVLEAAASQPKVPRVLVVGSSDEYGIVGSEPISEWPTNDLRPESPYAKSKAAVEQLVEKEFADFTIRTRSFPHIGPGQRPGFAAADFASQIVAIEAGRQKPELRVGNLQSRRDITDVRDVVRAYALLLERGQVGEVYNVCSGQAVPIKDVVNKLLALSRKKITVVVDQKKFRAVDLPVLIGNNAKLRAATGWSPTLPLHQTLKDLLDSWRAVEL